MEGGTFESVTQVSETDFEYFINVVGQNASHPDTTLGQQFLS